MNNTNEALAQKVIKGLKSRNMDGYYVRTKEDALKKALERTSWILRLRKQYAIISECSWI